MARIVYGIQGECHGHSARALRILEHLTSKGHEVRILSGGDAYDLLHGTGCSIERIPLFRFAYSPAGKVLGLKTASNNAHLFGELLFGRGKQYRKIERSICDFNPDMVITDFEAFSSYIARRNNIPLLAVDHQHIILMLKHAWVDSLSDYIRLSIQKQFIRVLCGRPDSIITTSFYPFPDVRKRNGSLVVGPIIGSDVRKVRPQQKNHITVYMNKPVYAKRLISLFEQVPSMEFHVFSNWRPDDIDNVSSHIHLHRFDRKTFVHLLGTGKALINSAGNQSSAEAIYLQKPILMIPNEHQTEQALNCDILTKAGLGEFSHLTAMTQERLVTFIQKIPSYARKYDSKPLKRAISDSEEVTLKGIDDFIQRQINI